jgi:hypothetical protein
MDVGGSAMRYARALEDIWDVLAEECGASDADRDYFLDWMARDSPGKEFRFQGSLGFGGKFWSDDWRVNCYRENETPERTDAIRRANARLATLRETARP